MVYHVVMYICMFLIAFSCIGDDNEQKISSEGHVTLRQIIKINCANDQHYMYSLG